MSWTDFRADPEKHFNPRNAVPDFERYFERCRDRSAETATRLRIEQDIRYGKGPLQLLDHYPGSDARAPLVVYIHGGYWRGLDKGLFRFIAEPLVARGIPVVSLNYDLCPSVTVPEIILQCIDGIRFVGGDPARFGGNGHVLLTGDSAGAHLAAMAMIEDWEKHGLAVDFVDGAALLTGVYDIEPVLHVSVNADIRLTPEMVEPCSPMRHPPKRQLPLFMAVGGAEPAGWIAQTMDYAEVCRRAGCKVDVTLVPNENHFSMSLARGDAAHPLAARIIDFVTRLRR